MNPTNEPETESSDSDVEEVLKQMESDDESQQNEVEDVNRKKRRLHPLTVVEKRQAISSIVDTFFYDCPRKNRTHLKNILLDR